MKENTYDEMGNEAFHVAYLIAGFIRNCLTEKEHDELDEWVCANDQHMQLFEELTDEKNLTANLEWMDNVQTEKSFATLQKSNAFKTVSKNSSRKTWLAVASILLIASTFFIYRYIILQSAAIPLTVLPKPIAGIDNNQLQPGGNKATLTISGGRIIDLNHQSSGTITDEQAVQVKINSDGSLSYLPTQAYKAAGIYHTLATPSGGQYRVELGDGTRIWLNNSSHLKYPVNFALYERRVELSGEAYFEVSKKNTQPFKVVLADSSIVTVLGTHFCISAFQEDKIKQVSLLEGSVAISTATVKATLQPGTQALIGANRINKKTSIDTAALLGWKNGLFVFHDAPIESILQQLARWYGAKVIYKGGIHQLFNATINRSEPISKLINLLELNGYVHFKTANKTIYVFP